MKQIDWKALLRGSFAGMTAPFAVHPNDNIQARMMFHAALNTGVEMNEILDEAEIFLKSQGCDDESIKKQLSRIKRYPHNPRKKLNSKRIWLITWESTNSNSEVVSIISSRKSAESVREFVEQLYISSVYSDLEKLTYARCPKDNPYSAEFGSINGARWLGRITCGHNPFLLARIVINLAVNIDDSGVEHLVWDEIETPSMQAL